MPAGDAFEHYRAMYIRYLQIFHKLERCYEGMLHPQKRADVAKILESVIARLVQLRHAIVKWQPLNPEVAKATPGKPLPWEYVDYDDKVMELKLQPEALEIPIPLAYRETRARELKDRDAVFSNFMQRLLGVDKVLAELDESNDLDLPGLSFTLEEAVAVIQRNERGRQGKLRAAVWKERRVEEAKAAAASMGGGGGSALRGRRGIAATAAADTDGEVDTDEEEMTPEEAAIEIQRAGRGFLARNQVQRARAAELVFIGMRDAPRPRLAALEAAVAETAKLRKLDQTSNREAYESALEGIARTVLEEEGTELRDKMRADRTTWFTSQLLVGVIPEDLKGYYAMLNAAATGEVVKESEVAVDPKAKKGGKDAGKKPAAAAAGAGKDKKGGKGKGAVEEEAPDKPPPVTGTSEWSKVTETLVRAYDATWAGRDESRNVGQRHDAELAREIVAPKVEESVRLEVDATMTEQFTNFLALKAGDKKKEKKGGAKKKKPKEKRKKAPKPLPGAKACATLELKDFVSLLIEHRVINNARMTATFSTFIGGINILGSKYAHSDSPAQRHPAFGFWMPVDPSMAQVREAVMHYAVLPIGSATVRASVNKYCADYKLSGDKCPRSLLLYGPHGCGKTHLVQAVVNALGAVFINLSTGNVDGKFAEKGGAAKLLHMAFMVAQDAALGPCVIYIDEVEKMLGAGGKKKGSASSESGPGRFKKDLASYIKSLNETHSVIVIGASSEPWEADIKSLHDCFDKKVYIPCPDYATRLKLWRTAIAAALSSVPDPVGYDGLTTSALTTVGTSPSMGADGSLSSWGGRASMHASSSAGGGVGATGASPLEPYLSALPLSAASASGTPETTSAIMDRLNVSALASVSNGYTAGSIKRAVRATLTSRRLERLNQRPLAESEFLTILARCQRVYADENDKFREFTDVVTGLGERRKVSEADAGGDKKKAAAKKK